MSIEEKIKHLENLIWKIESKSANKYDINKLSELIRAESVRENSSENPSKLYLNNLSQTISKQLSSLLSSKKKPENRKDELNDCVSNFKQDVTDEIGRLKFR